MKMSRSALAACCFLFAAIIQAHASPPALVNGQPIERSPKAAISFDTGGSLEVLTVGGLSGRVEARTNQFVNVQLHYPADLIGQAVGVQSVDGAIVVGATNRPVIGNDGTVTIRFKMGDSESLYRFVVMCGDLHTTLRFYAIEPGKRSTDPTILRSGNGK